MVLKTAWDIKANILPKTSNNLDTLTRNYLIKYLLKRMTPKIAFKNYNYFRYVSQYGPNLATCTYS